MSTTCDFSEGEVCGQKRRNKLLCPGYEIYTHSEIELLNTVSAAPDPVFNFNPSVADNLEQIDDQGVQSARWQIRVGLRYNFN